MSVTDEMMKGFLSAIEDHVFLIQYDEEIKIDGNIDLRACLNAAAAAAWQPISSAPRDGTRILAAAPDGQGWVYGPCVWCKTPHVPMYGFHFTEGDPEDWDICWPTIWMPLPKPPGASE